MSEPQKVIASFIGALLVHLVVFAILALLHSTFSSSGDRWRRQQSTPSANRQREVTITGDWLAAIEQVKAEPLSAALTFIDTGRNTASTAAPENARYESDRNTLAQSQLISLSPEARRDQPAMPEGSPMVQPSLVDQRFTQGENDGDMNPSPPQAFDNTPAAPLSAKTGDMDGELVENPEKIAQNLALGSRSQSSESSATIEEPDKRQRDQKESFPDSASEGATGNMSVPRFQAESLQSPLDGAADRVGEAAVDAVATPVGLYKKKVQDAISAKWHRYRQENAEAVTWGILKVEFVVDPSGHISNLEITKNEANQMLEEFSLRAIREAQLPPMPAEVLASVGSRGLLVQYDIIIY